MTSTARTVSITVVTAVLTTWIVASIPDLPTAVSVAASAWALTCDVLRAGVVPLTLVGTLLAIGAGAVLTRHLTGRADLMPGTVEWAFSAAIGSLLVVASGWCVVDGDPITAAFLLVLGAWSLATAVRGLVRVARFRAAPPTLDVGRPSGAVARPGQRRRTLSWEPRSW